MLNGAAKPTNKRTKERGRQMNSTLFFTSKDKRKLESTSFNGVVKRVQQVSSTIKNGVEWRF